MMRSVTPTRPAHPDPLLLGLDVGTSSVKVVLLTPDGRVRSRASADVPTRTPAPGQAEQDPDDWWRAVVAATRAALADANADRVIAIGLSGQMHTFVLCDATGESIRPAVTWLDTRAAADLPALRERVAHHDPHRDPTRRVALGLTLAPLVHLARVEAATLERAQVLLLAKDWLRARLTGRIASEPTDASATGFFDLPRRAWATDLLAALELPTRLLPDLGEPGAAAGGLLPAAARALGLRAGIPVAFGAGDQQAAALGNGVLNPGDMQLMVGSGAQALVVVAAPRDDGALHAFAHVEGVVRQASVNNAGIALDWVRDLLRCSWSDLYAAFGDAPPPLAPTFVPYLSGERVPLAKGYAQGAFLALRIGDDRRSLAQAAVAAVALSVADALRALGTPSGPVAAAGGGLRHAPFAQAVADASGVALALRDEADASAIGAALLAGIAAGLYPNAAAAAAVTRANAATPIAPRPERAAAWEALRARLRALDAIGIHELLAG
jgi:xylulokinase